MNDKPVGEQAPMCEFPVVLSVEPPVLAGRKKGMGKSEPADQLFFFFCCCLISPLKRCQDTNQ